MSAAYPILLLLAALSAVTLGAAVLVAVRRLQRQVTALGTGAPESASAASAASAEAAAIPGARSGGTAESAESAPAEAGPGRRNEIREAVAEALAEERERELAEARAFWAAQEAREAADAPLYEIECEGEAQVFLPRQIDLTGFNGFRAAPPPPEDSFEQQFTDVLREALDGMVHEESVHAEAPAAAEDSADEPAEDGRDATALGTHPARVPDMRRHPSHPDFKPAPRSPADQRQTADRLAALADFSVPLTDVRPGPLGTLDAYVFADGTTLCLTPGDRRAAERLTDALDRGVVPTLLGGSGIGGAYALTFSVGDESLYVLADRVVASA